MAAEPKKKSSLTKGPSQKVFSSWVCCFSQVKVKPALNLILNCVLSLMTEGILG